MNAVAFSIEKNPKALSTSEREAVLADPGFGKHFTDHMVIVDYDAGVGWHDARLCAFGALSMHPAAAVLHYAQEIFEGMKAYRTPDGRVVLFRPEENARRFRLSAERMAMTPVPEEVFLKAVETLVSADAGWVSATEGHSLYIRPYLIANEPFLGVRPAKQYQFIVIATPVVSYFSSDAGLTVWVSTDYSRAATGGTGAAKCGGNYAASLLPQAEAYDNACDQVLFLDACGHQRVEEMGGMNVFFVRKDGVLVTPPLNGNILEGITRKSVIRLAQDRGLAIREEPVIIGALAEAAATGEVAEAFACGTAAVIAPIARFKGRNLDIRFGANGFPVAAALKADLVGMQTGKVADRYGWVRQVA